MNSEATELHKAFNTAREKAIKKKRTHYPLRYVRVLPPKEPWKAAACHSAGCLLSEIQKLYPENHAIRIA